MYNIKGKRNRIYAISLAALMIAAGCATKIRTSVLMPGRVDQAAQFKSVAVMPFDGPDGKAITSIVEGELASVMIDNKQFFQIVDRGSLDKAMNEMKLAMTGAVDANTAAQVGKIVGAKGIYTGNVTASAVNNSSYTEKRRKCSSYRTVKDSKGRTSQECVHWYDVPVDCTKRTATFAFTPKLVEVETSRLIFSNTYESSMESKGCEDESRGLVDGQVMKRKTQDEAVRKFRMDVAPYYAALEFTLKDSTSGIASDAAKAKLKDGVTFAGSGRMDRACALWSEARPLAPDSISILFNLGICAETQGKPEEAQALYQQIDKTMTKPDDSVNKALARVTEQLENRKKLSQQVTK